MRCLVKATTGNGKQRYHTLVEYARVHQRIVSHGDKARVMIYWYYIQKIYGLNKTIRLSSSLNFWCLIHAEPFEAEYIYEQCSLRSLPSKN